MKVYFKQERLIHANMYSLILRFIYKEYIFRIFALINISHKRFNRVKFILRNYKKLKFTLDIYDYEKFNDFNIILENDKMIKYIFNKCYKRTRTSKEKQLIKEWKRKNTMTT